MIEKSVYILTVFLDRIFEKKREREKNEKFMFAK